MAAAAAATTTARAGQNFEAGPAVATRVPPRRHEKCRKCRNNVYLRTSILNLRSPTTTTTPTPTAAAATTTKNDGGGGDGDAGDDDDEKSKSSRSLWEPL